MDSAVQQATVQDKKLKAVHFAFDSADVHYRRGLTDRVAAMEAKLPVLQEEGKALELRGARIHAEVALTAALGGDYSMDSADDPASIER
jgi:multidrug efflux system outer membrane protein